MISETISFGYMYYIFADDKNINIYDGKIKFKKKRAFLKTFSNNVAFNEFKRLINEKVFKNIYLIMDLADSPKFESYFDKYNSTMKFILISAHSFDDYKLSVDKTFKMNNKERDYYFSNKFDLMKDIDSNIGKDDNEYFISFVNNEVKCTRKFIQKGGKTKLYTIEEQNKFWKKIDKQKGGFIINLKDYKYLEPKKNLQIITIKDKEKASAI
jgi:hypothetical protein